MKQNRRFKIDRRLLIAAAIIYILSLIILFISNLDEWNLIRIRQEYGFLIMINLPVLLFFAALRFPTMIYSKVLAGICTFWLVEFVLTLPLMLVLDFLGLFSALEGSLFFSLVFAAIFVFILICGAMCTAEAIAWINELREKKKAEDAEEGIKRMTKNFINFLRPRLVFALMTFGILLMLSNMQSYVTDMTDFVIDIVFRSALLLTVVYILWRTWDYYRYIKGLEHSGVLKRAVEEYFSGHVYCKGHIVLGVKYIFVEGEARIYEYENFSKYFYKWSDALRGGYWHLYAVKKDGTEQLLVELPYERTKKNYYEHIYPMINEIRIKSKDVVIEGPEFRK